MLIQAEFPMFGGRVACDTGSYACDKNAVYFHDWAFMIKTLRNFPAVFDYTMTNEGPLLNHQFAMELYALAKALDPMRPVSTSDGTYSLPPDISLRHLFDPQTYLAEQVLATMAPRITPTRLGHTRLS